MHSFHKVKKQKRVILNLKRGDDVISNAFNRENRLRDVEKGKAFSNNQDFSIGQLPLEVPIEDQPCYLTTQHQKVPPSMGRCSENPVHFPNRHLICMQNPKS